MIFNVTDVAQALDVERQTLWKYVDQLKTAKKFRKVSDVTTKFCAKDVRTLADLLGFDYEDAVRIRAERLSKGKRLQT